MVIAAGVIAAGSVAAGTAGAIGSMKAANTAADASKSAANIAHNQYLQTRSDLAPYNIAGQSVLGSLTNLAKSGQFGGGPDYVSQAAALGSGPNQQAALEKTPGYQFQLQQAKEAIEASSAARGLGVSGAELRGAANYAQGLASANYETQFTNLLNLNAAQQGNLKNQYDRLYGVATMGQNAAAQTGTIGANLANTQAAQTAAAGQAQAAGTLGVTNSLSGAITGGINQYYGLQALQNALQRGNTGGFTGSGFQNLPWQTVDSLNAHSAITGGT